MDGLSIARGLLIKASPWLATAFGRLKAVERSGLNLPGTDGTAFFYDPDWLAADLRRGSVALAHAVMHCLLGYVQHPEMDAACADVAAALLMDLLLPGYDPALADERFRQLRHRLSDVPLGDVEAALSSDDYWQEHRDVLSELLRRDDHSLWKTDSAALIRSGPGEGWEALRLRALGGSNFRRISTAPGSVTKRYQPGKPVNRSYRELLLPYAENREFPREDPDTFEPGLYAYGLRVYGDMPIVELSETREEKRIDELAIVIDTSGSCIEDLTARFLDETLALLADTTLFSDRFNLRILQCDAKVRRDDVITNLRDFERYREALEIVGGGGTDFRPAFDRIDRLIRRGAFRRLRTVLFFSDGMGLFPSKPPEYDVLFVFCREHYDDIDLPSWARRLVLEDVET